MAIIVATGTNGFIGANILEMLLHLNADDLAQVTNERLTLLVGADLPETRVMPHLSGLSSAATLEFVPHTLLENRIRSANDRTLAIIHNGAISATEIADPELFDRLNLRYTQMLWNLATDLKIPFIYASSAGVYGDGGKGFSDSKSDCHRYTPLSLYAKSKHDFDMWALQQPRTPPSWFGLRYFNVYGPHEGHKGRGSSMVFHMFHQIRQSGKVRLYKSTHPDFADGGQMRDFVYVQDICALCRELLSLSWQRLRTPSERHIDGNGLFLNIGMGKAETFNKMAEVVFAAMELPPQLEYIEMPEALARQYQNYTCADLRTWSQLGIAPNPTPLEVGATDYVKRFLLTGRG